MKISRTITAACLALAMTVGFISSPASAATFKGGVSVWNACKNQHKLAYFELVIEPYDVMGWKCRVRATDLKSYQDFGVDLSRQCRAQYVGSYADYTNFHDPFSWGCYTK